MSESVQPQTDIDKYAIPLLKEYTGKLEALIQRYLKIANDVKMGRVGSVVHAGSLQDLSVSKQEYELLKSMFHRQVPGFTRLAQVVSQIVEHTKEDLFVNLELLLRLSEFEGLINAGKQLFNKPLIG